MRAARAIWIASVCAAALAAGGAFAATAYVQVVDEAGTPIPGVTVSAYWFEKKLFPSGIKSGAGRFTSDKKGIVAVGLTGKELFTLRNVMKEGYVFEEYLNPHRDNLSVEKDTRSNPRRVVLRRLEPASFLLEVDLNKRYYTKDPELTFGIDLIRCHREQRNIKPYDDFFVSTQYRDQEHRWDTVFWTTNINCGLIATTNRRFTAPETGYVSRVEVSQEVFTNKAFTLYLKTRNPTVYAMIPFGIDDLRIAIGPTFTHWDFTFSNARINPYGGREMERDGRTVRYSRIGDDLRQEALTALLKEHRYPPKPDMAARVENAAKAKALRDKRSEIGNDYYPQFRDLDEERVRQKNNPEKLKEIAKKVKELDAKYGPGLDEIDQQLKVLREEAHTLNLPEEGKRE